MSKKTKEKSDLIKATLLAFVLSMFSATAIADDKTVTIDADTTSIDLHPYLLFVEADELTANDFESLIAQQDKLRWRSNKERKNTNSIDDHGKWFKAKIETDFTSIRQWALKLHWPLFNQISVTVYDETTQEVISQSDINDWQISPEHLDKLPFSFDVSLPVNSQLVLYIYADALEKLVMPVTLFEKNTFEDWIEDRNIWFGIVMGILLAMLAYNFCLSLFLGDRNYLYYCLYISMVLAYVSLINGVGISYLWGHRSFINLFGYNLFSMTAFMMAALFIRQFLNLNYYRGLPLLLANGAIIGCFISVVWGLVYPTEALYLFSDFMGFCCCVAGLGVSSYIWLFKHDKSGMYLTLSWIVLIVTTFLFMFQISGLVMFDQSLIFIHQAAFALESFLLSMALVARINREKEQRYAAQQEALDASRNAIKSKLRESEAIEKLLLFEHEAKEKLKEEVEKRTQELQEANKALAQLSETDALTGIYNRRYLDNYIESEFKRSMRNDTEMSLLMVDIDHFKRINDNYGHQIGDECLQHIAAILSSNLRRSYDVCARFGGEEFCLVIPDLDHEAVYLLAEKIRESIQGQSITTEAVEISLTVSIGISSRKKEGLEDKDKLIAKADAALYKAKQNGRNRTET